LAKCNVRITLDTKILRSPSQFCADKSPSSTLPTSPGHGQNQYAEEESSSQISILLDNDDEFLEFIFAHDEYNANVDD